MFANAFLFGGLVSLLTSVLILASVAHNPRIWLGDAPTEMKQAASPLTPAEKRLRKLWGIPIIASMLVLLPAIAIWQHQIYDFSYFQGFAFLWIGMMLFNLIDLLIIDWLVIVWWAPSWTMMPEVAHLSHLNTYGFHFKGFLTGCVLVTVWSALAALIFLVI